jgi:cephalosporin-C deacetylase-like acetyl esterase
VYFLNVTKDGQNSKESACPSVEVQKHGWMQRYYLDNNNNNKI